MGLRAGRAPLMEYASGDLVSISSASASRPGARAQP
jgi:hypothetical protein